MRFIAILFLAASTLAAQTPAERRLYVASFEQVWQTVRDKHWDPKLNGADWPAAHDELRPKVEAAASLPEARAVMQEMLQRLHQTHFGIVASDAYQELNGKSGMGDGGPGLDLRVVDGQALVTAVAAGSSAAAQGVKPGWEILQVDGKEIAPGLQKIAEALKDSTLLAIMQERAVTSRMAGEVGQSVAVEFLDGNGRNITLKLGRIAPRGKLALLGNLPPEYFWVETRKLPPGIGYVHFNLFFEPDAVIGAVQQTVKDCANCQGFIIDLRGNPGGIGGLATGVAGWFIAQKDLRLGSMYTRTTTIKFALFPRPGAFPGPLAILVDGCTASTSEILAGGLKDLGRARIFGTRTAGAALPSVFEKLPDGDGFQYAIANYISEGGQPLEGIGVMPDEEVKLTRADLLAARDRPLEAALSWILQQRK